MIADTYIVNVEGAIVRDGRYLMVVRGEEEYAPGGLSFPGGKVEGQGSSEDVLEETLRREIAEEVGLEVETDMAYLRSSAFVAEGHRPSRDSTLDAAEPGDGRAKAPGAELVESKSLAVDARQHSGNMGQKCTGRGPASCSNRSDGV
jgi:8-oxo-dGTP pyrophosphatase MutT (NUDIX family)